MISVQAYRGLSAAVAALLLAGCASTGATFRSGVGDAFLEHAPYYAGTRTAAADLAHAPIRYQRGASQPASFDPRADNPALIALLRDMNAYLDSLLARPSIGLPAAGVAPNVMFGCEADGSGDCSNGPAAPFDWGKPRMRLAVGRPSPEWTAGLAEALQTAGAGHVLVITLEVGQYWPQQTNWRGSKAVELGTRNHKDLPWLTSLETPVSVLQLTGAVVGPDGRAVRIGAEGLLARRTGIVAAGLGAQVLITDEDVESLGAERRSDLPGAPLAWQAALRTLVAGLVAGI